MRRCFAIFLLLATCAVLQPAPAKEPANTAGAHVGAALVPLPGPANDVTSALDDVLSKPLPKGAAPRTDEPSQDLKMLEPKLPTVLKGAASITSGVSVADEDPDASDRELMVEWDNWRNRFLRAVQLQVMATVNSPDSDEYARPRIDPETGLPTSRFPVGTEAWFDCTVTNDRRISKLVITRPSGVPEYDHAIISSIRAMEGTSQLQFPRGSRRLQVSQQAGIRASLTTYYRYHQFGDVERYQQPQY